MESTTLSQSDDSPQLCELPCQQFKKNTWHEFTDTVTPEHGLDVILDGTQIASLTAFPDKLEQLVLGHILLDHGQPERCPELEKQENDRWFLRSVKDTRPAAKNTAPRPLTGPELLDSMSQFIQSEGRWEATGCFHRAAVFDPETRQFLVQTEDIGRHNCLDRLAGWALQNGRRLDGLFLFVSARATASLVQKAINAGFACMISRSAVTTQGIARARKAKMTLVGFAREHRFTVFDDPEQHIQHDHS